MNFFSNNSILLVFLVFLESIQTGWNNKSFIYKIGKIISMDSYRQWLKDFEKGFFSCSLPLYPKLHDSVIVDLSLYFLKKYSAHLVV